MKTPFPMTGTPLSRTALSVILIIIFTLPQSMDTIQPVKRNSIPVERVNISETPSQDSENEQMTQSELIKSIQRNRKFNQSQSRFSRINE
jgi:hypothetical protein